jgi:hypothetical protein
MADASGFFLIRRFWNFLLGSFLLVIVFFLLVNFGLFGEMPDIKDLENPRKTSKYIRSLLM